MKISRIVKILTLLFIIIVVFIFIYNKYIFDKPKIIGFHDPENYFTDENKITITSSYFAWNKDKNLVVSMLDDVISKHRTLLITLEPWPKPVGFRYKNNDALLEAIILGEYDDFSREICSILSKSDSLVYVRWGHEMELNNSRYPWTNGTPELYINAYRRFVDICREQGKKFRFVWSPAGEVGLEKYWPGDEYVDIIGLSIYSFDQYDEKYVGHKRSFKEIFQPRYDRVKNYKKPVLISEMGVTGTDDYKLEWLGWMMKDLKNYKKLLGFIYLNTQDPQAIWEQGLGNPDWRLPMRATKILFVNK